MLGSAFGTNWPRWPPASGSAYWGTAAFSEGLRERECLVKMAISRSYLSRNPHVVLGLLG
jgi:hypothetical protein